MEIYMTQQAHLKSQLWYPKFWGYWIIYAIAFLLSHLPIKIQMWLGCQMGKLLFSVLKRRRLIASRNIELCLPNLSHQQQQQLLHDNFKEVGRSIFDTINAWFWSPNKIKRFMHIENLEVIDPLCGAIIMPVHTLMLEIGAQLLAQRLNLSGVYRPHRNPFLEYLQVSKRTRFTGEMIPKNNIKKMIKALRNKQCIWYQADQDIRNVPNVFVPLFAVEHAATMTTTASIARLGRAKVYPCFIERTSNHQYRVVLKDALKNFPSDCTVSDARRINSEIETIINGNQSQYLWIHRRFKTRPPEAPQNLYLEIDTPPRP
jgi:Kdo2-lipid IVA lauroyltransferase/acyltransferase